MSRPPDRNGIQVADAINVARQTRLLRARRVALLACLSAVAFVAGLALPTQNGGNMSQSTGWAPGMPNPPHGHDTGTVFLDPQAPRDPKEVEELNRSRQKQLKSDTEKLLQLATELKSAMDKSTSNALPASAERKAEQIEKLAHSVREKMSESF